jgi:secretion/DNA translocation related TadE-like protein
VNVGRRGQPNDGDAGSASLWALSLAMVLWVCVVGVVLAGVAVFARHRAATAADMAALAAASVIARSESARDSDGGSGGGSKACAAANAIALANDATVTSCHVTGQIVDVTTSVRVPALDPLRSLGLDSVSARARAGPG